MRTNPHLALALGALVLLQGCSAGWRRVAIRPDQPWPERQRLQVWHGGRHEQWHAVRLTRDSLSGVPFIRPPSCDSCRLALPLSEVDSLRTGDPGGAVHASAFLMAAIALAVYAYVCRFCGGT